MSVLSHGNIQHGKTIAWQLLHNFMGNEYKKKPCSNELYHFHNATKLNCNTNDEINMEFISINIKWNTEFNIFARCCFPVFFSRLQYSVHTMCSKNLFCPKSVHSVCIVNANRNKFCTATAKNPVFGWTQTHVHWQNRNNDVYKRNNPFLTQCSRLAASTNSNHHYHRRDSDLSGKNCCYCEFQFDFCVCVKCNLNVFVWNVWAQRCFV